MKMLGHITARKPETDNVIAKSEWTMDCPGIKYNAEIDDSSSDEVSQR